ncbi:MAG: hypothetical protein U9N02_02285 [Campylobacterota bacterium]|nr:hypothetical protein [Campylobacterota bacterium]
MNKNLTTTDEYKNFIGDIKKIQNSNQWLEKLKNNYGAVYE